MNERFWFSDSLKKLRRKINNNQELHQIVSNVGWLSLGKVVRMALGLFVGIWVARYLGPEQFGILNYAIAFVALFSALSVLGLDGIAVRELINRSEQADQILGSAFVLRLIGGTIGCSLVTISAIILGAPSSIAETAVIIVSFTLILKVGEVAKYWFEAQVLSKYVVSIELVVIVISAFAKIMLILLEQPLITFVWLLLAESFFLLCGLLWVYQCKGGKLRNWSATHPASLNLLKESWPLLLSGLAVMLNLKIDQVMLGQMHGNTAVGVYSAAVTLSELWFFLPVAIATSAFPAILERRRIDIHQYHAYLQKLYNTLTLMSFSVAIVLTFGSDWIITLLYGEAYIAAGDVLSLHIWGGVFVFLNIASGRWYIAESLQKFALYRALAGAIINITLNVLLIPKYGVIGAAWATIISHAVAGYLFDFLSPKTRLAFQMKSKALLSILKPHRIGY